MIAQLPDTVQQAWGEAATRDFTVWLETAMTEHTAGQDTWSLAQSRFDGLDKRQDGVEMRLTSVEHEVAELKVDLREFKREVNERFDRVTAMFNERFDRLAAEMRAGFAEVNTRFERQTNETNARFERQTNETNARFDRLQQQMLSQTRWTVGTLALFGTLIAILVGIGQLRP